MTPFTSPHFNIYYLGDSFKEVFGSPKVTPQVITPMYTTLPKVMTDQEILKTYQPESLTLAEVAYLLEKKEELLTNGYANIFYVKNVEGKFWAVSANWYAGRGGWDVRAYSVSGPFRWYAGGRVVSRNWPSELSVPLALDLSAAIERVKAAGYQVSKIV